MNANSRWTPSWACSIAIASLTTTIGVCADADNKVIHKFLFSINSKLENNVGGESVKMTADSKLAYTLQHQGNEVVLFCDSVAVKVTQDGKEQSEYQMSRDRFLAKDKGKTTIDVKEKEANERLREMLRDSFGSMLCKIQVDDDGREVNRTIVARPGAKSLVDNGSIDSMRFFHSVFFGDKERWKSSRQVGVGNGALVKGDLSFEKVLSQKRENGKEASQVQVKVSGVLKNDGFKTPDAPVNLKSTALLRIKKEQVFDRKLKEWVSGELVGRLSMEFYEGDKKVGTGAGTMLIKLELRTDDATP